MASKQQKADSISRYDFSEDGLSLNKLGVLRLISLVPKYPFVDGFANYDNVLEPDPRNPSNRIHYISKHQEIHKKDNFRLGCDFFAQKWENFDKTKILWLYPPRELVLKTINLVLNMELSVYLLVAVDENVPCMWAPWLESGGYWVARVFIRKFDKRGLYVKNINFPSYRKILRQRRNPCSSSRLQNTGQEPIFFTCIKNGQTSSV